MPLFRIKGLDPENTYLFDENPDEDRYEAADAPVEAPVVVPEPEVPAEPVNDEKDA